MAFKNIECLKPASVKSTVPSDGIVVTACQFANKRGTQINFIRARIGAALARSISLVGPHHRLRLLFGTEADAGKVMISVDNAAGKFLAKRDKIGRYTLTINRATADGLFVMTFPTFSRSGLEAVRPVNGQPPHFVFRVSPEMLAVDA